MYGIFYKEIWSIATSNHIIYINCLVLIGGGGEIVRSFFWLFLLIYVIVDILASLIIHSIHQIFFVQEIVYYWYWLYYT